MIESISKKDFNYYKDDIMSIHNFVTQQEADSMIKFFEENNKWGDIAFYGSLGAGLAEEDERLASYELPKDFFKNLKQRFKDAVECAFDRKLRANTSHAQKWNVGGFAAPHSDNSDMDGNPNAFEINKYVGILYINDDYEGGEIYWPDHNIEFKPKKFEFVTFPGGVENIHGVKRVDAGVRFTMVSFWDYAEIKYDQETLDRWEEEIEQVRKEQAIQKEEWAKGNIV
jgi:hypothetical protein